MVYTYEDTTLLKSIKVRVFISLTGACQRKRQEWYCLSMLGFWCRGYCCIKCILFIKISISRLFLNCHLFFIIKDSNYLGDDYKQSSSPYLTLPVINCSSRKPERDCGSLISCLQQSTESPAWLGQMFSVCPPNLLSALLHHFAPCSTSWGCPFLQLLIWFCQWKVPTGDWRDWGRIRATFCQALLWQWPHSLAEGHHGQHAASPSPEALTQAPWELHLSFPLRPRVQRLLLLPSVCLFILCQCPFVMPCFYRYSPFNSVYSPL